MKRLPLPEFAPGEVYATCVSGVSDADLAGRYTGASGEVLALSMQYGARAIANELYLFPSSPWGGGNELVAGGLTKDELTDLYTSNMVKRDQPARRFYDRLLALAPQGKCPFCEFGQVSTLDHFLSKARYPYLSVLPVNLVPACTDCNKGKGSGVLNVANQMPHPYFVGGYIEQDRWLVATLQETSPATATFSVVPPNHWPGELVGLVGNYMKDLDLASRFAIEAASELTSLSDCLSELESSLLIHKYLLMWAKGEREHRKNTWKAALYDALSDSVWYREGGFRRPPAQ